MTAHVGNEVVFAEGAPLRTGAKNRVIRDAIHGLISVDKRFWSVIDAPEVQRLRWIRQTGLAYLVYPGAEHSRFAHAIGVYGLARRVFKHLREQAADIGTLSPSFLDDDLELAFAAAALCHDLGHTAFSHVLEPVLLPDGFRNHEDCTLALLKEQKCEVGNRIRSICDFEQVIQLIRGVHWNNALDWLISSSVDIDRWDYLLRDAAAAGVGYGDYDLDWTINSLTFDRDKNQRPQIVFESQRGRVAVEHFFLARRSMYQQVYHHATVRGAGRLLRAVFERASDPARPDKYKQDTRKGIPNCLHSFLRGERPNLKDFLSADDATILTALKQWRCSSKDPMLRYLAKCFLERRLYKEIDIGNTEWETAYRLVKKEAKSALGRQKSADLPSIEKEDRQGLDYLVLEDNCEFKSDNLDEVPFDDRDSKRGTFEDAGENPANEIEKNRRNLVRKRLFVASDVFSSVQDAVQRQVNQ